MINQSPLPDVNSRQELPRGSAIPDAAAYYSMAHGKNHGHQELAVVREFIERQAGGQRQLQLLEVGCGAAEIVPDLPAAVHYCGVDPTSEVIAHLRGRFPDCEFEVSLAESLPFADASFDLVMSFFVLEHTYDPRQALREMLRVLRPHGHLIVLAPNHETPWSQLNATRHYSRWQRLALLGGRLGDMVGRIFGRQRFRTIAQNYTEATGRYELPDDDLRYITSAWETAAFLRDQHCNEIYYQRFMPKRLTLKNRVKRWLTHLPFLKYWGGTLFLIYQRAQR